ncbi:MAG: discoidin domain-containing protein, partial [Bacteroidales bacterium]|nr:discoidin domain-containing protein [Bacteroidales bacterium]
KSYLAEAEKLAKDIQSGFWCDYGGGYNAGINGCSDRYSDDSAWIVLAMLELYEITENLKYLEWAEAGCEYIMSCENDENTAPYGGIRWHESESCGTRTCSTAPTCLMNMMLYKITGENQYFKSATRLHQWAQDNGAQNMTTGLFYEGIDCNNQIDYVQLGYDTGPFLQAITIMYEVTGNINYLREAQHIAHNMVSSWVDGNTNALRQTGKWCGHDMTNALVYLYEVDKNQYWLDVAAGYLDFLYNNCKAENGLFNTSWDDTIGIGSTDIIDTASPARAFWTLAKTYSGTKPHGPVALFNDCNYGGYAVYLECGQYNINDMQFYGIGNNTISSVKVANGYTVKLYDNSGFSGSNLHCKSNISCLVNYGWNDKASSIIISHECEPDDITPMVQVNGSDWQVTTEINIETGDSILISPEPVDGNWSWTAPNGFYSTSRTLSSNAAITSFSNSYTATYTNACGAVTTKTFTLSIRNPSDKPQIRENLAIGKNVNANAFINGENPEKAVDGIVDNNSKWCTKTGHNTKNWLIVDLGDFYEVDTFVIQHSAAGGEHQSWNTRDYDILTSLDETNWKLQVDISDNSQSITRNVIDPVWARYVKLEVTDPTQNSDTAVRIYEFEIYSPFNSHCIAGDTTGKNGVPDCNVDLYDFNALAKSWLECSKYNEEACIEYIDMDNLEFFIKNWLSCEGNGCAK